MIGAKEGLSHFVLMTIGPGDVVLVPDPAYPIHQYSVIIAGGDLRKVPLTPDTDFIQNLELAMSRTWPKPKMLILSFPANPTTQVVDLAFFERIVEFARENDLMVLHDFAYAEIAFDGYKPPSILEVPGAKDIAIEFVSLSKSHSMAGWRVGFAAGNREMIHALRRIKSYLDYGMPQAIQIASITALRGPQDCVTEIVDVYRERRDALIEGLAQPGEGSWKIEKPLATMFVWARSAGTVPGAWGRSNSRSGCSTRRRSRSRRGSGSASRGRATCASPWSRTSIASGRPFAAFAASCVKRAPSRRTWTARSAEESERASWRQGAGSGSASG